MKKSILFGLFWLMLWTCGFPQAATNVGTEFWIAFPPNQDLSATLKIFISSDFSTSGTVTSAFPGVNQAFTVIPGVVTELTVPTGVGLLGGIENKGIHIVSVDPVAVYGLNRRSASTDAYMALPVPSLGTDYRILTYKTTLTNSGSCFSVVATKDATILTVFNHQTNNTSIINLDQGQTYHVEASVINEDVTGSRVQSNFPVSVYGSEDCTDIPAGCTFCDHIVEQIWPVNSWGKNFATVPLAGRDASGDIFRILAAEDGTDVSINGTLVTTLITGEYYESNLTGYNSITTSKATCLAQYAKGTTCTGSITGDPFMMLIPPREQFLTHYTIGTVSGFTSHWVNIVAPSYALGTIYQDGILIPNGAFTQIGTTNYYGAQRSITEGSHTFMSTYPFGVFVYGWTLVDSYGYPGGGSLSPVGTVNSVTLSPATASGQLNVTVVCFTAHVTDVFTNPVEGVLVNFNISGINPLTGNAYTNASGDAQYCYTQTGTTPGIDSIVAEVFGFTSDTSLVFWSYTPPCTNPTNGGSIGNAQSGCGTYTPATITSLALPSGQSGTLEYKWQQSVTGSGSGFSDIAGSNFTTWNPGPITQTTWYRRLSRVDCMSDWTGAASTNVIELTVIPFVTPGVTIASSDNSVCQGTSVTFTATPVYGGTFPSYQWKVNGSNSGTNNPTYTYTPDNNDIVTCELTSSEICTTNNPVSSNQILMVIYSNLTVGISISASANPVCSGTSVIFTATTTNGGTSPQYQWKVNGINVGTSSPTYTYTPANGDQVKCVVISSEVCTSNNPATSNTLSMTINNNLLVGVSIQSSANPVCSGIPVTFTATPANGGGSPQYQWKVNGINVGTSNSTYVYTPLSGDQVLCILTSNLSCTSNNPATSNTVSITINDLPIVTFTRCFDSITTINAKPIKLKGGIPLGGTYTGAGVTAGIFYPAIAGVGTKTITYTYTNLVLCSAYATVTIVTRNASPVTCGNTITDPRDNKTYPTVQIGSQCWMASNLNYGIMILSSLNQRDNCTPEKYCYNNLTANCELRTANYQWDELMQYDDTPGNQGLCPPGWHIPTETEWTLLFDQYINNGFAGSPLKVTGYSGFNALLSGAMLKNRTWDLYDFATFFWSADPHGPYKAWAHGMNTYNPSVSFYTAARNNAFSVRCIKD